MLFADDLRVFHPSFSGLQHLSKICCGYAAQQENF